MGRIKRLYEAVVDDGAEYLTDRVTVGCEWVGRGEGEATEMVDGMPCAIIGGVLHREYLVKAGRQMPDDAMPREGEPDTTVGDYICWLAVNSRTPADKWLVRAMIHTPWQTGDGEYVAVGAHFNGNPYGLDMDCLERVGRIRLRDCPRDFAGIREYLRTHEIKGIVWRRDDGEMCKVKREDFGFVWPVKGRR